VPHFLTLSPPNSYTDIPSHQVSSIFHAPLFSLLVSKFSRRKVYYIFNSNSGMKIQMFKKQKGVKKQYGRLDISIFGIQPVDTPDGRRTKVYLELV